jgi:predicted nucleic acid-binding protein
MKHLFLDTNILIDFLAERAPFAEAAGILFTLGLDKKAKIYCSALSFSNIYYILRQTLTNTRAIKSLKELAGMTEIIAVGENIIDQSLNADFKDFEDAIQYYSALSVSAMDALVTRNARDFRKSHLPILSPIEALALF